MQSPFNAFLNLLIESPGNIIYHLTLAFAVISSLQAALISRRSRKDNNANRMALGLGMLLLGQVVLFFSSGLAWQNIIEERLFLPPLDRAIMLFSLVWIVWLWAFPTPAKLGDLVTGFLNLGVVILFLFSYTSWGQESAFQHFNNTWIDRIWELAELILVLTGMAILLFSRPAGWEFGMGMFTLILAGTVAHLLLAPSDKDFSSYMRFGQIAAFPLLPTLLNRLKSPSAALVTTPAAEKNKVAQVPFPRTHERRRFSADPRTIHAWIALTKATDPEQILNGVTKALAHTMLSDICFIIADDAAYGQVIFQSGYDLIREEVIPGTSLEQSKLPSLTTALHRGKILTITETDIQPPDLQTINAALGLKEAGSLLFIPLFTSGNPHGGILFLSPYSNRQWNSDDQGFLASDLELITEILNKAQQPSVPAPAVHETIDRLSDTMRVELENLRQDNKVLLMELGEYRQNELKSTLPVPNLDLKALVALQQEAQEQISNLQAENDRLVELLSKVDQNNTPSNEVRQIESELRSSLGDLALLQNELADANARILGLERESRSGGPTSEDIEVITSTVQEIRQPLTSIGGYTELLLSESVGILGALQRKFLERIQASIERLSTILDDLVRVTMMSEGPIELLPQPIEFGTIVDGAVSDSSAQLREKDIALRVDLPEEMPLIVADRDAIQQIILHLLQNAGAATPQESTITLRARVQKQYEEDLLLIQVTDNGGGIRAEDLPRVFARNYRADKALIQGLGDTGVGLSIAKALVEAHGGRIWVESIFGQSTTISVLLPIHPNLAGTITR